MTGSIFFILAGRDLLYSTFFFFFFLAELLDTWLWRWVAFLIVFVGMLIGAAVLGLFGWRKVRRIEGPQQTIESVKEARLAFTHHDKAPAPLSQPAATVVTGRPRPTRPVGDRLASRGDGAAGPVHHPDRRAVAASTTCTPTASASTSRRPIRPPAAHRPNSLPLVIMLHGFGSFWWSWRHQLRGLSGARLVAVDLRGYGGSDKPPRGYDGWTLAGDTAGLIRALGHTSATLVGHADGGLVCWATAMLHPRRVRAIGLVSSPHPAALRRVRADPPRPGPRAVALTAVLPGADAAGAAADPPRRRRAGNRDAQPIRRTLACIGRLHRVHRSSAPTPSRSPAPHTAHWSTNAGPCAANYAARAGGS